jgi:hypothetical protein
VDWRREGESLQQKRLCLQPIIDEFAQFSPIEAVVLADRLAESDLCLVLAFANEEQLIQIV